ncbi:MAG TPA: ABC transporter permease [Candidatus Saccharimonadales bacterium]|nr:ABC transporter permease [Candidatus Saccharimonadales bacterium]
MKIKRYFLTIWQFMTQQLKRFFRDKVALFFTFLFPLIFLFVFGSLNRGSGDISLEIALLNKSDTAFSKQFVEEIKKNKSIKVNEKITEFDDARDRMGKGEIDSVLELPPGFGKPNEKGIPSGKAIVYYEEASPQAGQTFGAIMSGVLDGINAKLVPQEKPFSVEQKSTKTSTLKPFDYVFSGLIGFTILSLGLFGLANGLPADKKAGYLARLRATPLTAPQLLVGTGLIYLFIGLISIALMMAVGILLFGFQMRGDWLTFTAFATLGTIVMLGFGLAIGGWAKNEIQAAPLTQIIAMPMMFLSGSFFPRFLMPEWLQAIAAYLPLTPIIDGLRLILTENKGFVDLLPQLGLMGIWTLIIYIIAFKVFRWQ